MSNYYYYFSNGTESDAPVKASESYTVATYVAVFTAQFIFAALACFLVYRSQKQGEEQTMDSFLTARNSFGIWRIGWSFYAGAMGAWVITAIPAYNFAGVVGLAIYSLCCGAPVVLIAYLGERMRTRYPNVVSSSDFARWRYGPMCQMLLMVITLFNMSIAMLVEYISMGSLFYYMLGSVSYGIIIYYGCLTMIYTAWGGLRISVITDTFQGVASVILAMIVTIYVGIKYRGYFPEPIAAQETCPYPNDPCVKGYLLYGTPNMHDKDHVNYGLSALVAMPIALFTATIFSEAMWQRCWAAVDQRTLIRGAWLGSFGIITICSLSAAVGLFTAWQDNGATHMYYNAYISSSNVQFFYILPDQLTWLPYGGWGYGAYTVQYVKSWITIVVIVAAAVMSEGYVDALQTGFACTISAYFFRNRTVNWARAVVVVINVMLMSIAATNPDLSAFLLFGVTNELCACVAVPLASGVFDFDRKYINGDMVFLASVLTVIIFSIFGVGLNWGTWDNDKSVENGYSFTGPWGCPSICSNYDNIRNGMIWTWYLNGYDWKYYAFPVICSSTLMTIFVVLGAIWTSPYTTLESRIEKYLTPLLEGAKVVDGSAIDEALPL